MVRRRTSKIMKEQELKDLANIVSEKSMQSELNSGKETAGEHNQKIKELTRLNDLSIEFKHPLKLAYSYEPDTHLHFFQNFDLHITYSNRNYEKCLNEVIQEISVLWKEIVMAEDSELTSDALRIKQYLLSFMK